MTDKLDKDTIAYLDDPILKHILEKLQHVKNQNKRFKKYIEKTKNWLKFKPIKSWQAYDFYNYFCLKYEGKYKTTYNLPGNNTTRAFNRIKVFMKKNNIENKDYKDFIDKAFYEHFNSVITPKIGNICNPTLFKKLVGRTVEKVEHDELFDLSGKIEEENSVFKEEVENDGAIKYSKR